MSELARINDAEVMRLWRQAGLPEYFLGNGGTNVKLVEFAKLVASLNKPTVKLLGWLFYKDMWLAHPYRIRKDSGDPDLYIVSGWERGTNPYMTLEAAQAAAQTDFEARILACLVQP